MYISYICDVHIYIYIYKGEVPLVVVPLATPGGQPSNLKRVINKETMSYSWAPLGDKH